MQTPIGKIYVGCEPKRRHHFTCICRQVIERDDYGVRELKDSGFEPKTIVDVGGHVGTFTLMAASAWPNARIVVLEVMRNSKQCNPFSRSIAHSLDRNVAHLPNVTVVHRGLFGFFGYEEDNNVATWKDLRRPVPGLDDSVRTKHMWAKGISVRQLLKEYGIESIDLLKLDCEGSEVNILRECRTLGVLHRIDRIRGEWHFDLARKEIPRLLADTHHVRLAWRGGSQQWHLFRADRMS